MVLLCLCFLKQNKGEDMFLVPSWKLFNVMFMCLFRKIVFSLCSFAVFSSQSLVFSFEFFVLSFGLLSLQF